MEITQRPDNLCFAENIPDILISGATGSLKVTLQETGSDDLILEEIYTGNSKGMFSIRIKEIIVSRLSTTIPPEGELLFIQENIRKTFTLKVGPETLSFTALAGGVYNLRENIVDFLTNNLLTWQMSGREVKSDSVMLATYYSQEECRFRIDAIAENDRKRSQTIALDIDKCYTVNLSPAFWSTRFGYKVKSLNACVETLSGFPLTATVEYVVTNDERLEEYLYVNSLGGIDSLFYTGNFTRKYSTSAVLAKANARLLETRPELVVIYKQNTGYLTPDAAELAQDFFLSHTRYHVVNGIPVRIMIEEQENKYTAFDLNNYEFEYRHEEQSRLMNLSKPVRSIPLPPFWDNCRAYFDKKIGNKIIDRKSGLEIIIEGNKLHFPEVSGSDVFNKTSRSYWSEDIPQIAGKPRTWELKQITGLFTIDYASDLCTRVLFFRDVYVSVDSVLPIIVYPGLGSGEIAEVVKYLKEYYFLEDGTDRKLLTQENASNVLIIENVK